jgi:hypothetical protein
MGHGVFRTLQQKYPRSFANHKPIAASIKRGANTPGRERAELGKTNLRIKRIRSGNAAGQHGVCPATYKFVYGEFQRIEGGGAGGVQGTTPASQAKCLGKKPGRKPGYVTI